MGAGAHTAAIRLATEESQVTKELQVGPVLGVESDTRYTVCFLARKSLEGLRVECDGKAVAAEELEETASGRFWRVALDIPVPDAGHQLVYSVHSDAGPCEDQFGRAGWSFHVPARESAQKIRIAYASCNGFSHDPSKNRERPYALWETMREQHEAHPFSLLIMGGDQLYADEIWKSRICPTVEAWNELGYEQRIRARATQRMKKELADFYESLYLRHWAKDDMAFMMASVPSVMMWDDHDIFDGWGSYPPELQGCEVYGAIYEQASHHFELFQIRSRQNASLLDANAAYYSFGFVFRGHGVLGLDNRAERSQTEVMSAANWSAVKNWLAAHQPGQLDSLLVMSAVPVVYRSFAGVEAVMGATPWQEELEDDVRDHWSADSHEGEREKLILNLLDFKRRVQPDRTGRITILSGDVHVGSLGVIEDRRNPDPNAPAPKIHQVVSSGIVHTPPSWIAWEGLKALTGDQREKLGSADVYSENLRPLGGSKFIRTRNFATLEVGNDDKLWIEWICDDGKRREFGIPGS